MCSSPSLSIRYPHLLFIILRSSTRIFCISSSVFNHHYLFESQSFYPIISPTNLLISFFISSAIIIILIVLHFSRFIQFGAHFSNFFHSLYMHKTVYFLDGLLFALAQKLQNVFNVFYVHDIAHCSVSS